MDSEMKNYTSYNVKQLLEQRVRYAVLCFVFFCPD